MTVSGLSLEASERSEVKSVVAKLVLAEIAAGDDEESVNGEGGVVWWSPLAVGLP